MVAFAIIIRHALAIDASWGANRYANTVLGHVSLAATVVDAIVDIILLPVIPTIFRRPENAPCVGSVGLLVRHVLRRYETDPLRTNTFALVWEQYRPVN